MEPTDLLDAIEADFIDLSQSARADCHRQVHPSHGRIFAQDALGLSAEGIVDLAD